MYFHCSVEVVFIILDDADGAPLSGNEAVTILAQTQSLAALTSAGVTADGFMTSGKVT